MHRRLCSNKREKPLSSCNNMDKPPEHDEFKNWVNTKENILNDFIYNEAQGQIVPYKETSTQFKKIISWLPTVSLMLCWYCSGHIPGVLGDPLRKKTNKTPIPRGAHTLPGQLEGLADICPHRGGWPPSRACWHEDWRVPRILTQVIWITLEFG